MAAAGGRRQEGCRVWGLRIQDVQVGLGFGSLGLAEQGDQRATAQTAMPRTPRGMFAYSPEN